MQSRVSKIKIHSSKHYNVNQQVVRPCSKSLIYCTDNHLMHIELEMWANAQRDGRPAEHRWRPLFNAAVWLTPTTTCSAVILPRRETS